MSLRFASVRRHFRTLPTFAPIPGLLLMFVVLGAGCSSFNDQWRKTAQNPAPTNDIQGRWQGRWISEPSGHSGKLRCLILKMPDDIYQARFHAKYGQIFSFEYTVPLKVQRTGETFHFSGEANLGRFAGGVYRYDGHANGTNFFSDYSSKYDHGTFTMRRP